MKSLVSPLARGLLPLLLSVTPSAAARADWMPHIHQYWFEPAAPTVNDSLTIVFFGTFPYDCGEIADFATPDPYHLEFTMRPGPACQDSTRNFTTPILLGAYPEGLHTLHVRLHVEFPGGPPEVHEDSLEFLIAAAGGPPPPPPPAPPPPPYTFMPYISRVTFDPAYPNVLEPTGIEFEGWSPFPCFAITEAVVDDNEHFHMVLEHPGACGDTVQQWTQRFSLGHLPLGPHDLHVALRFEFAPDSTVSVNGILSFVVFETSSGPPAPEGPPADSLEAVMSPSRPNPFVTETRFGVSLEAPARGRVMVYDVHGRRVATLFDGDLPRGTSQFTWDGRRADGDPMPEGIYFYRLALPDRVVTRRVVLLGNLQRR